MGSPYDGIEIGRREVAHRLITDRIREQILTGKLASGTELPSTADLAARWKTSVSTVHIALKNLVKEGLLGRYHGSGTFVLERAFTLKQVGIYFDSSEVWTNEERIFYRVLLGFLESKLEKIGCEVKVYVDRRPQHMQKQALPELVKDIESQRIQGLLLALNNGYNTSALLKLPIASSILSDLVGISNKVGLEKKQYFNEVLTRFYAQGYRSVALISHLPSQDRNNKRDEYRFFGEDFRQEVTACKMTTRDEWIRLPVQAIVNHTLYGYEQLHALWSLSERPDAIIVYPDMVVRGVITAALELGLHKSNKVMFCFHNNAHINTICPFEALWVVTDEEKIAEAMIEQVRAQIAGTKVSPIRVPLEFKFAPSVKGFLRDI